MGLTRLRDLVAVGVLAAIAGYFLVRLNYNRMPPLPRLAGVVAAVLGIGEAVFGWTLRRRLAPPAERQPRTRAAPVAPLTAARALVAAKATALAGAALMGLWAGLLVHLAPSWALLTAAQADAVTGLIGLGGALVMTVGALYLERCCRTPDDA